jgi:rubrerythrin
MKKEPKLTEVKKENKICKRCDYKWISRLANPKACPSCKQYNEIEDIK